MSNVSSSNSQEVRVPKLRFPGFEGEWDVEPLSKFLTESKIPGSDGKQAKKLSVKLWAKGVVEKNTVFEGSENTQYYIRKAGQLMYGKLDFLNCAFGIVPPELDGYESTLDAPAFDISNIDSTFLLNKIIQRNFYKKNGDIANGSRKAKRIHPDTFLEMEIAFPELREQTKIAGFITCLNTRIEKQCRLTELLKSYKRGALSKLFPKKDETMPEYRFAGFTEPWEKRKLGDMADIVGGGTPSTVVSDYWDGDIDWYSPAELSEQIYLCSSQKKITEQGYINCSAKMLPEGTVLFTSRAGIGKTAILAKSGCTNQGFQSIVPHKGELDSYFIYSRTEEMKKYGETTGAGSTFAEVSGKQMAKMELIMPKSMDEQQAIGRLFQRFDQLIAHHQSKLDEFQKVKSALLQQLFI